MSLTEFNGSTRCKICSASPEVRSMVDSMLLEGYSYARIIAAAKEHGLELNGPNLSTHKNKHLSRYQLEVRLAGEGYEHQIPEAIDNKEYREQMRGLLQDLSLKISLLCIKLVDGALAGDTTKFYTEVSALLKVNSILDIYTGISTTSSIDNAVEFLSRYGYDITNPLREAKERLQQQESEKFKEDNLEKFKAFRTMRNASPDT